MPRIIGLNPYGRRGCKKCSHGGERCFSIVTSNDQCEYNSEDQACTLCKILGLPCTAEMKLFGNKSSLSISSRYQGSLNTLRLSTFSELGLTPKDLELLFCEDTRIRHLPSFSYAPLAIHPSKHFESIVSSKPLRYACLAELAAWKYEPDAQITMAYLEKLYAHFVTSVMRLPVTRQLSVSYCMLALSAYSHQTKSALFHAEAVSIASTKSQHLKCSRGNHYLWILQATNGYISLLRYAFAFTSPYVPQGQRETSAYLKHIQEVQKNLCSCMALVMGAEEPTDLGSSKAFQSLYSLKVLSLFQLVQVYGEQYWFVKNYVIDESNHDKISEALSDVLRYLFLYISRLLNDNVIGTGTLTQLTYIGDLDPLVYILSNATELAGLSVIYHIAVLIRHSIVTDPSVNQLEIAHRSAMNVYLLCYPVRTSMDDDQFVLSVRLLSLFFASLAFKDNFDQTRIRRSSSLRSDV